METKTMLEHMTQEEFMAYCKAKRKITSVLMSYDEL